MEAVELGLREVIFRDGRVLLERLYNQPESKIVNSARNQEKEDQPAVVWLL